MQNKTLISPTQMSLLLIGFIFGTSFVINVGSSAKQDTWIAYIIGWIGGFILVYMYTYIYTLYSGKTLIEILSIAFGKYVGKFIGFLYVFYFINLASLVLRDASEYMVTIEYHETPIIFISICLSIIGCYATKSGIEVIARGCQIILPLSISFIIFQFFILIKDYNPSNALPFFESNLKHILGTALLYLTFPFGETVIFLMLFPYVNKNKDIPRFTYISTAFAGLILLCMILQNIFVIGADKFSRDIFAINTTLSRAPMISLGPIVSTNIITGGGIKFIVCLYSATKGLAQLINIDDSKHLVLPIAAIIVPLSLWIHTNLSDLLQWTSEIYYYYAIPFQIIIPLLILAISLLKKHKSNNK